MSAHDVPVQMFMLLHALPALTNQEAKCVGIFFSEFVRFVEVYRVSLLAAAASTLQAGYFAIFQA